MKSEQSSESQIQLTIAKVATCEFWTTHGLSLFTRYPLERTPAALAVSPTRGRCRGSHSWCLHRCSRTDTGVRGGSSGNSLTQVTTNHPPAQQWAPPYPTNPPAHSRTWPAVALSAVAALLGTAALIVALTRPTTSGTNAAPATSAPPTYTSAEVAAAHQKLCEVYKLAARSVQIDTNSDNPALAGVAAVNGAVRVIT